MPFEYSCFISFRHGRHELAKEMIRQLFDAVAGEIEVQGAPKAFIDWEEIKGGDLYEEKLAAALCKSACMILAYTPSYFDEYNTFCAREYRAMELLETDRLSLLGSSTKERGLIIPIIFRGEKRLPKFVKDKRHYYDFQSFTLSGERILKNPEFELQIRNLAEYISDRFNELSHVPEDVCKDCDSFRLPPQQEVSAWVKSFSKGTASFPSL